MAKRIYQVAKSLGTKGVVLVHYLRDQGFDIKSHMAVASPEMMEAIEKKYASPVKAAKKKAAKKATAKKTAKKATAKKKTAKRATKAKKVVVNKVEAEAEVTPAEEIPVEKKATVQVVKKRDQEEVETVGEPAAAAATAVEEAPAEKTPPEPEKPVEKPRVIRYAPGMEPGARTDTSRPPGQRAGSDSRTQDFQIRSRPRRSGPGGPGGPGGHPGQRQLTSARSATHPGAGMPPQRGRKRRKKKSGIDEQEIKRSVRQTMASIEKGGAAKKRRRTVTKGGVTEELTIVEESKLRILPLSTLAELANAMKVPEIEVIATCMRSGLMVTINQRLETEDIELIANEYEFEVEFISEFEDVEVEEEPIPEEDLKPRGPIVTVMGHVDHGKTKLLDFIRSANVAAHEAGDITQHIGAYSVDLPGGRISFLDTPGHEAFTAMRARGTSVTDIVILVVAADDGVMPQTVEAINHAKAAGVPIIVAVNKIDLPAANPDRVKQELLQHNITVEEFGGDTAAVPISAKLGTGVDKLLEMVMLQAELMELKGAPDRPVKATVIEAKKDPGRGVVFTTLIQQGTLKVGLPFDVGLHYGTVRALVDEWGNRVESAGPGIPVEVLGANGVPEAGDLFAEAESEVKAREVSIKRQQLRREQEIRYQRRVTLDELYAQISKGEVRELKLVLKGDVSGSVEAMADNFQKLSTDEVRVQLIHKSVGTINESDVILAAASGAIIIGFNVRPQVSVREKAKREQVEIRTYDIIYEAVDEVKRAMSGLLAPEKREKVLGSAEVRQVFKVPKIGSIAGCYVIDGSIERSSKIRVMRDGVVLSTRKIASLKRFKEDVGKVETGFECGIGLADFQDVKEGDILEAFIVEEIARNL